MHMLIKNFIYVTKLINTAYFHKKHNFKVKYKLRTSILIRYFYKHNYIKYIKYDKTHQKLIIYINYCNNNNINSSINFFKIKQHISINHAYVHKLNYNYLISVSSNKKEYLIDKFTALKYQNNGRLIAVLY